MSSQTEMVLADLGQYGKSTYIDDTTSHSGDWFKITFIADTVIDTLTNTRDSEYGTSDAYAGDTFKAGTTIYGRFENIVIDSGALIAYEGPGY